MPISTRPASEQRAAVYLRRSRSEKESITREVQKAACAETIRLRGWLHDPGADVFADFGKSAYRKTVRRPGFERLLAAATNGTYDHIVVYRLDRFSRDWKTWADALSQSEASFVIHSATEGLSSSSDRMAVQFLAAVAEQESRNISDRGLVVKAELLEAGKWPGGVRPFGFAVVPAPGGKGKVLVVDEVERALVLEAVERVLHGESVRQVAMDWNARGILTSMGKAWWPSALARLLRSPLLIGERVNRGTKDPEQPYPALLDHDTYNRLSSKMKRRTTSRTRSGGALLSGLLVCGACQAKMGGYSEASRWSDCYRCPRRSEQGPQACPGVSISTKRVEEAVVEFALLLMQSPNYIKRVMRKADDPISAERDEWAKLSRNLERLEQDYYNGDFDEGSGKARYKSLRSELLGKIRKLEELVGRDTLPEVPDAEPLVEFMDGVPNLFNVEGKTAPDLARAHWDTLDRNGQREVLRSLLHEVVIAKGKPQQKGVPREQRFDRGRISVAPWAWDNGERRVPLPDAMNEVSFGAWPDEEDDGGDFVPDGFTPDEWEAFEEGSATSRHFDPFLDDDK